MKTLLLIVTTLCLCALPAWAQQDTTSVNKTQSNMTFNFLQPANVSVTDAAGSKMIITVIPDMEAPVKVDAMKTAQDAVNDILPVLKALIDRFPTQPEQAWWRTPMIAARLKLEASKAKLDALYPVEP